MLESSYLKYIQSAEDIEGEQGATGTEDGPAAGRYIKELYLHNAASVV